MAHTIMKEQGVRGSRVTLSIVAFALFISTTLVASAFAADSTQPVITSITPGNNALNIPTHSTIAVQFSEPMNPNTITSDTFMVTQRTTPATGASTEQYRSTRISGDIIYSGTTATFIPTKDQQNPLQPGQEFGNVFTVTVTPGVRDLAGNGLARNYVWSFTTGASAFYTGTSTSQTDQTPSPSAPITIAPVPFVPSSPAPTPAEASASMPWAWIIGGIIAIILVILALIVILQGTTRDESTKTVRTVTTSTHTNPFGDIHPVIDLEGIGPEYSERLEAIGIKNTEQLWNANAASVAKKIDVPLRTVEGWQHMAELSSIKDIGPQYAELLERSGIHTIALLKACTPDKLLALVRKKQDSLKINIQGSKLGRITVAHWITQARNHDGAQTHPHS